MKPKTDRQREVVALSATLPPITAKQRQWAVEHVFTRTAFMSRGKAWCSMCGHTFGTSGIPPLGAELLDYTVVCPHCGKKLKVESSRRQKFEEKMYYTILTTCKGYQVCRNFTVSKYIRQGEEPYYSINEAVQNWIAEDGHEEVIARPIQIIACCYDWNTSKPMELRDNKRHDPNFPDKYSISGAWIYPERKVLPLVKRNGYTARNQTGLAENDHVRLLLTDREAEMLEKNSQFAILKWKSQRGYGEFQLPHPHAIRIANRNKYRVKDASMWLDYLDLLEYFHLDTHNAHFVCPRDLKAEHDRLLQRKRRIEAKKAAEEKRREAIKWEEQYRTDKAKFFGVCFGNGDIVITVIQSVADMAEEGKAMHHCVYDNGYYKKPNVLILSAKAPDGKRLATIELNLKTYKVVQCRAACNKRPAQHDEIINLINQNINLIKQAA